MKILTHILIFIIHIYQNCISRFILPRCRFYPSCSSYCLTCLSRFSLPKALWYSLFRIIKCNPLTKGGVDYVPRH